MARLLVSIIALFTSILLFASGNTLLGTLSSLRLSMAGFDAGVIGPILACYAVGAVVGTIYTPAVIRRVGYIRAASAFAAIAGAAALLHPMTGSAVAWAVLRGLVGVCIAGLLIVIESWINARASNDNRGTLFSFYQVTFYFAAFGGQALVSVGDPASYEPFSLTAILVGLALVPLALTRYTAPVVGDAERLKFSDLYGISPVALVSALVSGAVLGAFNMMGPAFGSLVGLSVNQVSAFMALSVLAAMVVAWPAGHFSDRFDRRFMAAGSSAIAAVGAAGLAVAGAAQTGVLYALVAVFMGFAATLYPFSVAIMNDRLQTQQMVSASAGLLLFHGLGSVLGPVGASALMSVAGPSGLFVFLALAAGLLCVFVLYRILVTERVKPEDQEEFIVMSQATTPYIAELDPWDQDSTNLPDGSGESEPQSGR